MKKEAGSTTGNLTRLIAVGAVILAVLLYYFLVLGQHADKIQYIGGRY